MATLSKALSQYRTKLCQVRPGDPVFALRSERLEQDIKSGKLRVPSVILKILQNNWSLWVQYSKLGLKFDDAPTFYLEPQKSSQHFERPIVTASDMDVTVRVANVFSKYRDWSVGHPAL